MRTKLERSALMMELRFKVKPRTKDPKIASYPFSVPPIATIATDSVTMKAIKQKVERTYKGGEVRTYLIDADIIQHKGLNYLVLLLGVSDKRPPDHVVINTNTKTRRTSGKAKEDADEYSSHIVINLTPNMVNGQCYRVAFEEVPQMQSQYIERYLKNFFKVMSKEKLYHANCPTGQTAPNGGPATVNILLDADLTSVPSDELIAEIQNGVLGEVELSREVAGKKAWDQKGYTVMKSDKLILEAALKKSAVQSVLDLIGSVCETGKAKNFTMAKFNWTTKAGKSKTVRFDCESTSLVTKFFIRRDTFTLKAPMPDSVAAIEKTFSISLANWLQ